MFTEAPVARRALTILVAVATLVAATMAFSPAARAAKPDPELIYVQGQAGNNPAGNACNYTTFWQASDVSGKWATVLIESRDAGSDVWVERDLTRRDISATPLFGFTFAVFGDQPASLEVRATITKNNGSVVAQAVSPSFTCTTTTTEVPT